MFAVDIMCKVKIFRLVRIIMTTTTLTASLNALGLPDGFTYVKDPRITLEMNYFGSDNFIGRPINGYRNKVCILTEQAAKALIAVMDELEKTHPGYTLKIFDTYRPHRAVENFLSWAEDPNDIIGKNKYYPDLTKAEIFEQRYIFPRSSHSRGSTVDLTILDSNGVELDMGTEFDFFGSASHTASPLVSEQAHINRQLLFKLMDKHGFENLPQEWWHYTLRNEPFPDQYFDFEVA